MASSPEIRVARGDRQKRECRNIDEREQDVDLIQPLMRESSIYSLTLDEIQNTVCEPGKTFGSMNMDELLTNIWSVEEYHAPSLTPAISAAAPSGGGGLQRQGSFTIPAPLSRKTVDEVWSEIHRGRQQQRRRRRQQQTINDLNQPSTAEPPRQPTFGEMTLEDFLIKAGIVREGQNAQAQQLPATEQQYGMQNFQVGASERPGFSHGVGVGLGAASTNGVYGSGYAGVNGGGGGEVFFGGGGITGGVCVAGINNEYESPLSPVTSDGMGAGQVDRTVGVEVDVQGGRKRPADGSVDKVVERRQRRMIKNRESAARSRARKQAYTVELEAELNQLKEENTRLKEEERKVLALRKQLVLDSIVKQSQSNAQKAIQTIRHCRSCCW